jgi:predicted nucleotidyltransferase
MQLCIVSFSYGMLTVIVGVLIMKSHTDRYKHIILPIILKYLPKAKIILYGSRARKDAREGSDIDIALDNGSKIDDLTMAKLIGDIEDSSLPICFDIVDFNVVSEHMQKEIIKDGIVWHK